MRKGSETVTETFLRLLELVTNHNPLVILLKCVGKMPYSPKMFDKICNKLKSVDYAPDFKKRFFAGLVRFLKLGSQGYVGEVYKYLTVEDIRGFLISCKDGNVLSKKMNGVAELVAATPNASLGSREGAISPSAQR